VLALPFSGTARTRTFRMERPSARSPMPSISSRELLGVNRTLGNSSLSRKCQGMFTKRG
jgi:hypothetical protein